MQYFKLGNSDLTVSRICLGCMGFGDPGRGQHSWTLDEAHSREIIRRAAELSEKRGVTMTGISLAWLLTRVTAPVVGATKPRHVEDAAKAAGLALTDGELRYLEELYVPHAPVGVMAQNTAAKQAHVWSVGDQKL